MQVAHRLWQASQGWDQPLSELAFDPDWILVFAERKLLESQPEVLDEVRQKFPNALYTGGSSAGEISGTRVFDDSLSATFVKFEKTRLHTVSKRIDDPEQSKALGIKLAHSLPVDALRHVFVISDGLKINGSELVSGLLSALPKNVTITGGLCGDGSRFERSYVMDAKGEIAEGLVSAVGFYGHQLQVGFGSLGGWDPFGPERVVTKSKGNIVFTLDGRPALAVYKKYLGKFADQLPAAGLRFPLRLRGDEGSPGVVRTILAIDEEKQCMIFAGDIPEGKPVRFMKANYDRLVDGASDAAQIASAEMSTPPELALLISCVGRKIVLDQRIEEEVEAVADVLGSSAQIAGFYSYGEIAPFQVSASCELHNQTMTVTTFAERVS
jgi:hypothetical protein